LCKLPKSHVILVAGGSSRHKRLLLARVDAARVMAAVEPLTGG